MGKDEQESFDIIGYDFGSIIIAVLTLALSPDPFIDDTPDTAGILAWTITNDVEQGELMGRRTDES